MTQAADKLCCTSEQRTDSPPLPNARQTQHIHTVQAFPADRRVSNASQWSTTRPEDIRELQMLFAEAQAETNTAEMSQASPSRSQRSIPKSKGFKGFVKKRLSRDNSKSVLSLKKKAKEKDNGDVELQEQKRQIHKSLLNDHGPAEGGYDSDAAPLPDIRDSIVDRITKSSEEDRYSPVRRSQAQRAGIQSVDWAGTPPDVFSWPQANENSQASAEDASLPAPKFPKSLSDIGVLPTCKASSQNLRANIPDLSQAHQSETASSVGSLPSSPKLKPTRLPSLSSSVNTRVMRLSADASVPQERLETPFEEEFVTPCSSPDKDLNPEERQDGPSEDSTAAIIDWPLPGSSVPEADHFLNETAQVPATEIREPPRIETPQPSPSPARKLETKATEPMDSDETSLHLYHMRISHHLRTDSALSALSRATSRTSQPKPSINTIAKPTESPALSRQPTVKKHHKRQQSSSAFGSAKVPATWGKVLGEGETYSDDDNTRTESFYEPSSIYSTRPNSPNLSNETLMTSSANIGRSGYEVFSLADVAALRPDGAGSKVRSAFPVISTLVESDTKENGRSDEPRRSKALEKPLKVDSSDSSSSNNPSAVGAPNAPSPVPSSGKSSPKDPSRNLLVPPTASSKKFSRFLFFRHSRSHSNLLDRKQLNLVEPKPLTSPSLHALDLDGATSRSANLSRIPVLGLDGSTGSDTDDPLDRKPGRLARAWALLDSGNEEQPTPQTEIWERALKAHREEKSALFLSPEQGGRSKQDAAEDAAQSLFRPRSGSTVGKRDKARTTNNDKGKEVNDAAETGWFGRRSSSLGQPLRRAPTTLDPLERVMGDEPPRHKSLSGFLGEDLFELDVLSPQSHPPSHISPGVSPGASPPRQRSTESLGQAAKSPEEFFTDDNAVSLGAWSRYPSHTRNLRTGSAGSADLVKARDFAYQLRLSDITDTHGEDTEDDEDMSIKDKGMADTDPSSKGRRGLKKRKEKTKSRIGTVPKSKSMTFGKQFFKNYVRLFRSQSEEFRRWGHGHRSSIAEGGILEHPELEILPPIFPSFEPPKVEDEASKEEAGGTETSLKVQVDGASASGTALATGVALKSRTCESGDENTFGLRKRRGRSERRGDKTDSEWKEDARLLLQTYDTDMQQTNTEELHVPESSTDWCTNAAIWTNFAETQNRVSQEKHQAQRQAQVQKDDDIQERTKVQKQDPAEEQKQLLPTTNIKASNTLRTSRPTKTNSTSEEWLSDARLFSQLYESCLDPLPLFTSSEDVDESPLAQVQHQQRANTVTRTHTLNRGPSSRSQRSQRALDMRVASAGQLRGLGAVARQGSKNGGASMAGTGTEMEMERRRWRRVSDNGVGDADLEALRHARNQSGGSVLSVRKSTLDLVRVMLEAEEGERVKAIRATEGV